MRVAKKPYLSKGRTHVVVEEQRPDHFDEKHIALVDWKGGNYAPSREEAEDA